MSTKQELINGRYLKVGNLFNTPMSEIFFVVDTQSKAGIRWLAKKVNLLEGEMDPDDRTAERDILLKTRHQALPKIYDTFIENGALYIIRDYIAGNTLEEVVRRNGPAPENTVRRYCREICDIFINELHRVDNYVGSDFYKPYPIIFQDLKPSNIILDKSGRLNLIDFGIARSSPKSMLRGKTHGFSAPEQVNPAVLPNVTMDIYGFGATIYYLLTASIPNYPPCPIEKANNFTVISEGMRYIIGKCMRQNPNERYQSFSELAKDLDNIDTYSEYYRKWAEYYLYIYKKASKTRLAWMIGSFISALAFSLLLVTGAIGVIGEQNARIESWAVKQAELAYTSIQLLDYDEAVRISENALQRHTQESTAPKFKYIIGIAYFNQGDYPAAEEYFEAASEAEPENDAYRRDYAVCLAKLGRIEDAISQLEKLPVDNLDSAYVKAQIYEIAGFEEEAAKLYESCFAADGDLRAYAYISAAGLTYNAKLKDGTEAALNAQIQLLERAEISSLTGGRTLIADALRSLYLEKSRQSGDPSQKELNFGLWLDKSIEYKKLGVGGLKTYLNMALVCIEMDKPDEAREILDEAMFDLGESHELCFLYAIIEALDLGKKSRDERDYEQFLKYAVTAVYLAPYENENTRILRDFVKEHGLEWSDPIWKQ